MTKKILAIVLALVMVMGFAACGKDDGGTDGGDGGSTGDAPKIYYIGKDANSTYWQVVNSGAQAAADELGIELISLNPNSESEIDKQITMVEEAVNNNADAIVLAPLDTNALITACADARAAGVFVSIVDSMIGSEDYDVAYKTDNKAGGALVAKTLAEELGGSGKIFIINAVPGSEACIQRDQGFIEEIEANWPDIELVNKDNILTADNDINKAMQMAQDAVAANPDIDAIFADNANATKGVAQGIKEAGTGTLVGGFDSDVDLKAMLGEGDIFCLAVQSPYKMGYMGVMGAYDLATGVEIAHGIIDTGVVIAKKDNMDEPDIAELL